MIIIDVIFLKASHVQVGKAGAKQVPIVVPKVIYNLFKFKNSGMEALDGPHLEKWPHISSLYHEGC